MTPFFRITLAVLVIIAGSMLAYVASAAIVSESDAPWQLADGSKVYSSHATEAACWEAYALKKAELAVRTSGQLYLGCQKKNLLKFGRNPAPTPVNCAVSDWSEWSVCENGQQSRSRTVVTQPANGGAACPVLTESQACESPPQGTWAHCSNENERCGFTGTRMVRYGAGDIWTQPRAFLDGVNCSNDVFGDPIELVVKSCQVDSTEQPPPGPRSELLTWTPPTKNTDGSDLTDLVGYAIYVSQNINALGTGGTFVAVPGATSYRVEGLTPGVWYFAIVAVAADDRRSALSNIVQKFVQ